MNFIWVDNAQWSWLVAAVARIDRNLTTLISTVNSVNAKVTSLLTEETKIMATLDDVLAEVTAESSQIDAYEALFEGLKTQLADALASAGTVTPAMQAQIDNVFNAAKANSDKIAAAITANTPTPAPAPGA